MKNISKPLLVALMSIVFLTGVTVVSALGDGSITGAVYLDAKCDGFDLSDKPLVGVPVTLSSQVLKKELKAKSDAQGNFRFSNLAYAWYSLKVDVGKAYRPTNKIGLYQISEVNGAVSDNFVFCKK